MKNLRIFLRLLERTNQHPLCQWETSRLSHNTPYASQVLLGIFAIAFICGLISKISLFFYAQIILVGILHFIFVGKAFSQTWQLTAFNRKTRDFWHTFVLTGVDAHLAIISKWIAVIRSWWGNFGLLGLIHLVLGASSSIYDLDPVIAGNAERLVNTNPEMLIFLGALLLIVIMLQLSFVVSVGILAATNAPTYPPHFSRAVTTYGLLSLSNVLLLMTIAFPYFAYAVYMFQSGQDKTIYLSHTFFVVRDTHLMSMAVMLDSGAFSFILPFAAPIDYKAGLGSFIVTAILYAIGAWIALQFSVKALVRRGMVRKRCFR